MELAIVTLILLAGIGLDGLLLSRGHGTAQREEARARQRAEETWRANRRRAWRRRLDALRASR